MRDVAREAGVALATVYRYFTSKEHLYAAALLDWASNFPRANRQKRASDGEATRPSFARSCDGRCGRSSATRR